MYYLISLCAILILSSCSSLQKKVCSQDYSYKKAYQTALKGESLDEGLKEASVCTDYDTYSPKMFTDDFKRGYAQGKKEYCIPENYEKWGMSDGENGLITPPNSYSSEMKICIKDSLYKKTAKALYKKSLTSSYCQDDRMNDLGKKMAQNFKTLNSSGVRKFCPKKYTSLVKTLRTSYKLQMKLNCTPSFWMIKAEQAVEENTSKAYLVKQIEKCPESKQGSLTQIFLKAYNDKKQMDLREKELELARTRQNEILDIEKERLELEKQKTYGAHHHSRPNNFNHPYSFYYRGLLLSATCHIDSRQRMLRVVVKNPNNEHISLSGYWILTTYDIHGNILKEEKEHEFLSLSREESEEFTDSFVSEKAYSCSARYLK